ncbi:Spo0B domain-containing protein [Desulfolucanica intricata]|uniref:Spo0B domain-containing protein n=1 Tax=Desulfolucanica intricata TaxID=1285191 RepID=UPI00082C0849|nr:Spo0B domain-containing protein [Desulfolucanica intricata]
MDVRDLLKVMQVQRHDFLNHLQVISGLVQLGKTDRVKEYIDRICRELQLMSNISRIKVPEIAAAMMIGNNLALERQVDIDYCLKTDLNEIDIPGEILGWTMVEILKKLVNAFSFQADNRLVNLIIERLKDNYTCRISVKSSSLAEQESLEELIKTINNKLGLYNGRVDITIFEGRLDISLILPAGKYICECIG